MSDDSTPAPPALRIVRGDPTAEELAALVAVLATRRATGAPATGRRGVWSDPFRLVRRPVAPGVDGWRRSARPG